MSADAGFIERAGCVLRAGTTGLPNLTKPELRELAAAARALAASAEAEIAARPVVFPASLPPWLVMQWLPLDDVAAALRVASSWRGDAEQYFRIFAEHHSIARLRPAAASSGSDSSGDDPPLSQLQPLEARGSPSWEDTVRCHTQWQLSGTLTDFQRRVFCHYLASWIHDNPRFIPVDEVVAGTPGATAEKVNIVVAFLVSVDRLHASTTGSGHRFEFQVDGDDVDDGTTLAPLHRRVLKYYIAYGTRYQGCDVNSVAAGLGIDLGQARMAVNILCHIGNLYPVGDNDHHLSTFEEIMYR